MNKKEVIEILNQLDEQTYTYKVLKHILFNEYITSWDAIQNFGNTRLSATIHELRHRYNIPIDMELIQQEKKKYGKYYIKYD